MSAPFDLRTIARVLGGEVRSGQVVAPAPGHSRRDRSMTVRLSQRHKEGFVVFGHAGEDFALLRDYVKERLGLDRGGWSQQPPRVEIDPATDRREAERNRRIAAEIIAGMVPLTGTPGEAYLREARGIDTAEIADILVRADAIGWNSAVELFEPGHALHRRRLGCIVAVMTDAATGRATGGISRTYLDRDGRKLGKAMSLASGGIVRISADEDVTQGIFIAEGLETALTAAALGLRPIWATGSTSIMRSFGPIAGIECLTVIADHDPNGAGLAAAQAGASAWRAAGKETRILMRDRPGDLNDAVTGVTQWQT